MLMILCCYRFLETVHRLGHKAGLPFHTADGAHAMKHQLLHNWLAAPVSDATSARAMTAAVLKSAGIERRNAGIYQYTYAHVNTQNLSPVLQKRQVDSFRLNVLQANTALTELKC
jgi:hypothetical protein